MWLLFSTNQKFLTLYSNKPFPTPKNKKNKGKNPKRRRRRRRPRNKAFKKKRNIIHSQNFV